MDGDSSVNFDVKIGDWALALGFSAGYFLDLVDLVSSVLGRRVECASSFLCSDLAPRSVSPSNIDCMLLLGGSVTGSGNCSGALVDGCGISLSGSTGFIVGPPI